MSAFFAFPLIAAIVAYIVWRSKRAPKAPKFPGPKNDAPPAPRGDGTEVQ